MIKSFLNIIALWMLVALCSCGSTRPLQYMQGAFDTTKLSSYTLPQPIIQKGDLLSIVVFSDNPAYTGIYNQVGSSGSTGAANSNVGAAVLPGVTPSVQGYLVDEKGEIHFQSLGALHVEGLTRAQLTDTIATRLRDGNFLTNPYCNIRFLNYKVTVIGDIARPGVYSIPSEQVNILEVIGLAGDLNVTARRDNILVIREQNGKRQWGRIDITKPDIFASPFYQLQQNDVVYVDLSKNKAAAGDVTTVRNISIAATIVSTLAIVYSILKK